MRTGYSTACRGSRLTFRPWAYIEVVSTTGTAAVVAEGAPKPELVMPADQKQATARKIAAHVGVSWEAYSGDFPSFVTAVQTELMRVVVDCENLQLYGGTGEANGQVNGLLSNANILTFTATGFGPNAEHWTDLLGAIATLRTGPALAEPDLLLLHPNTWAALRSQQDQYGRFYVAADPSRDQVEQAWGVDVLESNQFTPGVGVLFDTTLYGRAVVREGLVTRIGYSGTDFTQNVVRLLSEERITQTIERPQAICKITGLPTAAPSVAETKSTARK
jgi:HK97 family phage major capsid protein